MAQRHVETLCAELCARRADRATTIVPELRRLNAAAKACVDGPQADFIEVAQAFHQAMVNGCGNETLALVAGMIESICFSKQLSWGERAAFDDSMQVHRANFDAVAVHEEICELIAVGETAHLAALIAAHSTPSRHFDAARFAETVDASAVRRRR